MTLFLPQDSKNALTEAPLVAVGATYLSGIPQTPNGAFRGITLERGRRVALRHIRYEASHAFA
jgi:hypothetical protein